MPYDFDATHERILTSAKNEFLEHGFKDTNIRQICRGAGVTNGAFYRHFESKEALFSALVDPCVSELTALYNTADEKCFDNISSETMKEVLEISNEAASKFVNYMYDNLDVMRLLLLSSSGTPYANFVDKLVALEVTETTRFLEAAEKQGIKFNHLSRTSLLLICHCSIPTVFEFISHNYSREEALDTVGTIETFFNAGWEAVIQWNR